MRFFHDSDDFCNCKPSTQRAEMSEGLEREGEEGEYEEGCSHCQKAIMSEVEDYLRGSIQPTPQAAQPPQAPKLEPEEDLIDLAEQAASTLQQSQDTDSDEVGMALIDAAYECIDTPPTPKVGRSIEEELHDNSFLEKVGEYDHNVDSSTNLVLLDAQVMKKISEEQCLDKTFGSLATDQSNSSTSSSSSSGDVKNEESLEKTYLDDERMLELLNHGIYRTKGESTPFQETSIPAGFSSFRIRVKQDRGVEDTLDQTKPCKRGRTEVDNQAREEALCRGSKGEDKSIQNTTRKQAMTRSSKRSRTESDDQIQQLAKPSVKRARGTVGNYYLHDHDGVKLRFKSLPAVNCAISHFQSLDRTRANKRSRNGSDDEVHEVNIKRSRGQDINVQETSQKRQVKRRYRVRLKTTLGVDDKSHTSNDVDRTRSSKRASSDDHVPQVVNLGIKRARRGAGGYYLKDADGVKLRFKSMPGQCIKDESDDQAREVVNPSIKRSRGEEAGAQDYGKYRDINVSENVALIEDGLEKDDIAEYTTPISDEEESSLATAFEGLTLHECVNKTVVPLKCATEREDPICLSVKSQSVLNDLLFNRIIALATASRQ